jgi:hypothetical protein
LFFPDPNALPNPEHQPALVHRDMEFVAPVTTFLFHSIEKDSRNKLQP